MDCVIFSVQYAVCYMATLLKQTSLYEIINHNLVSIRNKINL